ncbi:MAG: efflux RND transporter permease subunit [Phycisphaerales bacterium]|nr:efflux RND transporter permease subunit [Phycisphaerales bacterium]
MVEKLIEFCLRNRTMVLLLTLFLIAASVWAMLNSKVDAIPDLSDVQVIVHSSWAGQAPDIIDRQVTYPLTTAMLQVPGAEVVRGYSMFGDSYVYIIFEDGTDPYWARSRVLEQLSFVSGRLPAGVTPQLGPDATGVGWVYQYVLTTGRYCPDHPQGLWHDEANDKWYAADPGSQVQAQRVRVFTDRQTCPLDGKALVEADIDLAELRSLQDWQLRFELMSLDGVAEVAPVGGFVKQYQVVVDPVKLLAYDIPLTQVRMAIAQSNVDVGGRVVEIAENEYMVRGLGYLGSMTPQEAEEAAKGAQPLERVRTDRVLNDLSKVAVASGAGGTPIYLSDVAEIRTGPEIRQGIAEWGGQGEVVGGIVAMRNGGNARATIERVKQRLDELQNDLPDGVAIKTAYDRSDLIDRSVATLSHALLQEMLVVGLVCILFLLHARSELVAIFTVPTGVLTALLMMHLLDINANIMSLGGIAVAIGIMVDSSVVMVENAHIHLDREADRVKLAAETGQAIQSRSHAQIMLESAKEVGPSLFFSLVIITVSFLPVFVLGQESGRMFKPLAYTKTFAIAAAAVLSVTVIPVLMTYLITARVLPKQWGRWWNLCLTIGAMVVPAGLIMLIPLGELQPYRQWMAGGWALLVVMLLLPQKIVHEHANPINRFLQATYNPAFVLAMRFKRTMLVIMVLGVAWVGLWITTVINPQFRTNHPMLAAFVPDLGSEFMPPLEEGDLLYMPTTEPGISITAARELLQQTDKLISQFPEVETVMGKIGRADTATDPAPMSMIETTIQLKRDKSKWRQVPNGWGGTRPITIDELVNGYHLPSGQRNSDGSPKMIAVPGMNNAVQFPGLTNSWTMPIRTRIDMLSTGIKTPVGVKILGPDLSVLDELATQVAQVIKTEPVTANHTLSAFAERSMGGNYLDIEINRDAIARYGLSVQDVQEVIQTAMGGMEVTTTVEGLARYPVNLRYPHELRDNIPALKATMVPAPGGVQIPLVQLADFQIRQGASMIKSENARPTSWVYIDPVGIDVGAYVQAAQQVVSRNVKLPAGYSLVWAGGYQYMQESNQRLMIAIPVTLVLIIVLLYLATHSWLRVGIVLLAVPFSLIGAIAFMWLLDYNLSVAAWVGIIGLAGLDAETGLIMLLYLDSSFSRFNAEGRMRDTNDLWHAIHDGAVRRIRPKTMTVVTDFIGLTPLMWASGAGADTMKRVAAPMIGGLASSFILELLIYPVLYYYAKRVQLQRTWHRAKISHGQE